MLSDGKKNLEVWEGEAAELLVSGEKIVGLKMNDGQKILCKTIVIAAGTFLKRSHSLRTQDHTRRTY